MVNSRLPYFIGIAGGTAGGKTTFARRFVERAAPGSATIVYLDSYYRSQGHIDLEERKRVNYDHPDAFEFPLLLQHLETLKEGGTVMMPRYDFGRHTRAEESDEFHSVPVILVEGILALHHPLLRAFYDSSIFVDAPEAVRLERRIERDIRERGRTRESVVEQWNKTVQPMHYEYCLPTKVLARHILSGTENNDTFIDQQLAFLQKGGSPSN